MDETFPARAKEAGRSVLIAGQNYGQGSSREHAALAPLYLGVKAVIAKSFARIHMANLINNGILPLTFADEADYDKISQGDVLKLAGVRENVEGKDRFCVEDETKGIRFEVVLDASPRLREMLLAGGLLNYTKNASRS